MSQHPSHRRVRAAGRSPGTALASVLVVEDDRATAEMIEIVLGGQGLAVHVCPRGEPAVAMAQRVEPVVALVDLLLPDLGGAHVCRAIRANAATPIVTMSAARDPELIAAAAAAGAADHLVKPFTMQQLVGCVSAHLPDAALPGMVRAPKLDARPFSASIAESIIPRH
ncbi:response regulator [Nocardia takedensis]